MDTWNNSVLGPSVSTPGRNSSVDDVGGPVRRRAGHTDSKAVEGGAPDVKHLLAQSLPNGEPSFGHDSSGVSAGRHAVRPTSGSAGPRVSLPGRGARSRRSPPGRPDVVGRGTSAQLTGARRRRDDDQRDPIVAVGRFASGRSDSRRRPDRGRRRRSRRRRRTPWPRPST